MTAAVAVGILGIVLELFHISPDTVLPFIAQVALPVFFLASVVFGAMLGGLVTRKVLIPRLQRLADDEKGRRRWLVAGGTLFVVAKMMQFSATFFR